ncbi:MAG: Ti-type conjugative transfer system protein TraG, partial [Mesorhizobium sp.]
HNLLTGFLAHVMLSPEYAGRRNLRSLRQIVSEPEPSVLALLRDIQEHSASAFIRETLGVFTNMTEQTFSGVYSTASKDTQWLSLENYAALVCGNTFRSSDIVSARKDVFLNIPASILRSYPGIGRVIIGSLINAMIQADGRYKRRALFMLDEVDLLGYMRVLEEARDRGRKYGISMMLMYQSVGQMERHFGKDGATSWIDGCAFASYAAIKALDTARNVSAQCGEMTVEVKG